MAIETNRFWGLKCCLCDIDLVNLEREHLNS